MRESPATESAPAARREKPTVLYVMGAGRSGSTILGVTLGNCAGVFFAGELDKWPRRSGTPALDDAERVRFWQAVLEDVPGAQDMFGERARDARLYLERSSAVFRVRGWRARRRLRERYRRVSEDVFRAVARRANVNCVVDTSHYPLRARELQALSGIDLHLLYLVREPQSVVASFGRDDVIEPRFSVSTTNAYLWLTHVLSLLVFLRQPRDRRLFVRHEDFVANPEAVLRDILDRAGSAAAIPDLTDLSTGIPLQGNRLIRSERVALNGRPPAASHPSRMTTVLQLPWAIVLSRLRPATAPTPSSRAAGRER